MPSDLNSVTSCGCAPAGVAADDHLAQLVHVGPVDRAVLQRLHEVAGLQAGLVLAVHDDRLAAAHGDGVDLRLAEEVRADGVDVRPLGDPVAVEAPARGWSWR